MIWCIYIYIYIYIYILKLYGVYIYRHAISMKNKTMNTI